MKTLDEWVSGCEDEILKAKMKEEVIRLQIDIDRPFHKFSDAIVGFCNWEDTIDGDIFWNDMYVHAMMEEGG